MQLQAMGVASLLAGKHAPPSEKGEWGASMDREDASDSHGCGNLTETNQASKIGYKHSQQHASLLSEYITYSYLSADLTSRCNISTRVMYCACTLLDGGVIRRVLLRSTGGKISHSSPGVYYTQASFNTKNLTAFLLCPTMAIYYTPRTPSSTRTRRKEGTTRRKAKFYHAIDTWAGKSIKEA